MIAKRLDESKSKLQNVLNIARLHHTQAMKFYLALQIIFHRKRKNDHKTTGSQIAKYNLMASMYTCIILYVSLIHWQFGKVPI